MTWTDIAYRLLWIGVMLLGYFCGDFPLLVMAAAILIVSAVDDLEPGR